MNSQQGTDTVADFGAVLAASGLQKADVKLYSTLVSKINQVEMASSIGTDPANKFVLSLHTFALRMILEMAVKQKMPYGTLRRHAIRGDITGILGTSDVENTISERFFSNVSPEISDQMRADREERDQSLAKVPCGDGCWFCCATHRMIDATPADAERIWEAVGASKVPGHEHPNACPALGVDGRCRAYSVRPHTCRQRLSTSKEACCIDLEQGVGSNEEHVIHLGSPFDSNELARLLAMCVRTKEPFLNLLTTLRALRSGASMSDAVSKGRRSFQRFDKNSQPKGRIVQPIDLHLPDSAD